MWELVLVPIPGASPTGKPARNEAEFEQLKAEIDKLSGASAAAVDWSRVVTLASELLEKKTKDLLVLSYGVVGSLESDGFAALADGLHAFHQLVSSSWESLFPEIGRMRARIGAIEWLVQRASAAVTRREAGPADRPAIEACMMHLETLAQLLHEKIGATAPGLGEFQGALREKFQSVAEPEPPAVEPTSESPSTASSGAVAAPRTTSGPAIAHDLSSAEGRDEALKDAMSRLKALAAEMRRANARDALAYRLMRVGAWGQLRQLPTNEDRVTRIRPLDVSEGFLQQLDDLGASGEWTQVIERAETRFADNIFWLDLQYHIVKGLEALGTPFHGARDAVVNECRGLLRALPGLEELQYTGGVPFAGDGTRLWIRESVLASGSGGGGSYVPASADEAVATARERVAEAKDLSRSGKPQAAIQLLADATATAARVKERLLLRTEIANLLAEAKEPRLAVAQMELLDEELRRTPFEQWDPALGVFFLQTYLRHQRLLARAEGGSTSEARRADELYARLSRLDAVAALAMKP